MKRIKGLIITSILLIVVMFLGYGYRTNVSTKAYYRVYYKDQLLGAVTSKEDLERYIDDKNTSIKEQYKIDNVYVDSDINLKKVMSYNESVISVSEMYDRITKTSSFTIDGYVVRIKRKDLEDLKIYLLDDSVFEDAVNNFIYTYVGKEEYNKYINDSQEKIVDTGSIIENVYIENEMTIKKERISIENNIFTDSIELSQYLVFGNNNKKENYVIKKGDTITKIAYANKISVDEFLISNPSYTSESNILMAGDSVQIRETNPQINVIIETYAVEDSVSKFKQEIRYDDTQYVGYEKVIQVGKDGTNRNTQRIKYVNGNITFVDPISTVSLVDSVTQIVVKGDKIKSNVGDLRHWTWPVDNGWYITDNYFYRINPITGKHEHHSGIDIAGTGYGSNVYAANNGTIVNKQSSYDFGNYIIIDHNNGYWTLYAHLNGFANINVGDTVVAGQVIGYVGSTGWSTGPHLHLEVHKGSKFNRISPWSIY